MDSVDYLGIVAGILTTSSFFPQVYKIHKTKKTDDLSFLMFLLTSIGMTLWMIYGIILSKMPIIFANGISVCMIIYILSMKIKSNLKNRGR